MAMSGVICLRSDYNNKYLRSRVGDVQTHGLVQFSADKPIDAFAQFEIVNARCDPSLIHIKSRYTNKYLVRWSPNHHWITALADEPNETKTSWACTLFKPVITHCGETKKAKLMHVQLGNYATCYWKNVEPYVSNMFVGKKDIDCDSCSLFTIIDWASIFKIPKLVALRGQNDTYVGAAIHNGEVVLQLLSHTNPYDDLVAHEVFQNPNGTVSIKSRFNGKFWRLGHDDWIVVDVDPTKVEGNVSAMFRPNVLDLNVIALLNMSNTTYVKRLTSNGRLSLLAATTKSADAYATLRIKDLSK